MRTLNIERLQSGGVITNYFCTSRCGHCLYRCSPRWPKEYLAYDKAITIFRAVRRGGCRSVHIGGGEPMLHPDRLKVVLAAARDAGIGIDYVETNAAWFRDAASAKAVLKALKRVGLGNLLVSISPFHNEFIPLQRTLGVIEACRACGIGIFPWVNDFLPDLSEMDNTTTHTMAEYTARFGGDYLGSIPQRYWIHPGGRALATFRGVFAEKPVAAILRENHKGCWQELNDTSHFHIDLFGNYIPGLCSGLAIHCKDLGSALDEKQYPLLTVLASEGISGLYALAADEFDYTPSRKTVISKCDLCNDIRSYLVSLESGSFPELVPKEYYRESV